MPGFNHKGPMGCGSMTGRRMGKCTHFDENDKNEPVSTATDIAENEVNDFRGRGLRFGQRGRGRGFGFGRQNRCRHGGE